MAIFAGTGELEKIMGTLFLKMSISFVKMGKCSHGFYQGVPIRLGHHTNKNHEKKADFYVKFPMIFVTPDVSEEPWH